MTSDDTKKTLKDIGDRAPDVAADTTSAAKAKAAEVVDGVRDFAARTSDAASDMYGKVNDHVRNVADRMPDPADAVAAGRRVYAKSSDTVGRHVSKQPLEALLLAGAIGYLVGWASNRG